jgi:hypothetical protein
MRTLFETNGDFAMAWAAHLAGKVRNARLRPEVLSVKTVDERLDVWHAAKGAFFAKDTWKSVVQDIGVGLEAFYREITRRLKSRNSKCF